MPPGATATFTREPGGEWWVRDDTTPPSVSFKRERTGLRLWALRDHAETRTDPAAQFELTGREDLGGGQVATQVEPGRMTVSPARAGPPP